MNWYKFRLRSALLLAAALVFSNALLISSDTSPLTALLGPAVLLR